VHNPKGFPATISMSCRILQQGGLLLQRQQQLSPSAWGCSSIRHFVTGHARDGVLLNTGLVFTGIKVPDDVFTLSVSRHFAAVAAVPQPPPTPKVFPTVAPPKQPASPASIAPPKKPKTSWLFFVEDFRQNHPGLGKETLLSASKSWKALAPAGKQPFEAKYEEEKQKYKELMASFTASGQQVPKAKKTREPRDPEKPKRPVTGFFRFAIEYRQKNPKTKVTEATKAAKHIWDGFKAEQRKVYEAQFEQDMKTYSEAMAQYKSSGKQKAWDDKLKALKKAKAAIEESQK